MYTTECDGYKTVCCASSCKVSRNSSYSTATPVIGIAAFNMATGDYYTLTSGSATGFAISFYNSGGTRVVRNFDLTATGYGKG